MKKVLSFVLAVIIAFSAMTMAFAADTSYKPYENSQYFTYGDYDIHYRVEPAKGEMKGRILMIHGFVCSTYAWRNMAANLSNEGYECVMVDVPNFGFSTRETADMTIVDRETLILELMKSIDPETENWILAGHSMGGGIAVNIATMVPIKALMLYCPCPQNEFPQAAEKIVKTKAMEGFMNLFFKYGTKLNLLVKLVIFAATNNWSFAMKYDVKGVTAPVQYDGFGAGICEMMYNVKATDMEAAKNISSPVLLCQAEKDIILNDEQKSAMNDAFPNATTYFVKGGGHQCIEDRADELTKVTLDFLNK
ncbi:MAG: alpha/beta hydrolase [Clostridia bacterium]|nr:alpha/beta hydrolase [Clostridia bacterium]